MGVPASDQVAAAVTGGRVALHGLLATAQPFVTRYCRARLGCHDATADRVAREVCRAVLVALPDYREQDGSFLSFVYRIAAGMADAQRACPGPALPAPAGNPNEALPPEQREILVLRVAVGLSAAETAAILGCTDARVRVLQHRALDTLRASLQPGRWEPAGKRSQTGYLHDRVLGDQERGCDDAQLRSRPRYG